MSANQPPTRLDAGKDYDEFNRLVEESLRSFESSSVLDKDEKELRLYNLWSEGTYKEYFYEALQIVGGAFSVLEEVSKQALLLFRREKNSSLDVKDCDFFWFPYEAKYFQRDTAEIIDRLFLTTRESQKINRNAPDFLRFLNREDYPLSCLTNGYKAPDYPSVIYCDNAEITVFILCYLELLRRSNIFRAGRPDWPINSPEEVSILDGQDTVKRIYDDFSDNGQILTNKLYGALGLIDSEGKPTKLFDGLISRLSECSKEHEGGHSNPSGMSVKDIPAAVNSLLEHFEKGQDSGPGKGHRNSEPGDWGYPPPLIRLHRQARFPIIPYLEILLKREPKIGIGHLVFPVWKSYSFAPEVKIEEEKERKEVNVVFALLTVNDEVYGDRSHGKEAHDKFRTLARFIRRLGQITADTVFYNKLANKRVRKQAARTAISQVMARNMSHNIGSHVSYRATNLQIKRRVRELYPAIDYDGKIYKPVFADWLDHLSDRLDKYEIYRNEYLSDFDLAPKSVKFYRDLVLPFCENLFVMDNIAAGEQLNYQDLNTTRLKIRCFINRREIKAEYPDLAPMFEGGGQSGPITYPDYFPYLIKNKGFDEARPWKHTLEDALNHRRIRGTDVEVCIHSEQAVYSILENFIRNSAKHKPKGGEDKLTVYIDLRKGHGDDRKGHEDDHYCLYIYDDTSRATPKALYNKGGGGQPGIYQKIGQSLLDPGGRPRRSNWGYADMKINSFLLWHDIDDLDDSKLGDNFKLVTVTGETPESGEATTEFEEVKEGLTATTADDAPLRFGYHIKLSASKKILWIGDFGCGDEKKFKGEGLVRLESFRDLVRPDGSKDPAGEKGGLSSFQFAVLNLLVGPGEFHKVKEKLPGRVILINGEGLGTGELNDPVVRLAPVPGASDNKSMNDLLRWCWHRWLDKPLDLYAYFENMEVAEIWSGVVEPPGTLKFIPVDKIREPETLDPKRVNVIYDRHGGVFTIPKLELPEEPMNFATGHSIIFLDKGSEDFAPLYYPPAVPEEREFLAYELMDAATTNVFVVDERIADYAANPRPERFSAAGEEVGNSTLQDQNWIMYAAGKLFVVHEVVNGRTTCHVGRRRPEKERLILEVGEGTLNFSTDIKNLGAVCDDRLVRKDVLIIHRTYLDQKKIGLDPKEFLAMAGRKFGMVFINSGGGRPPSLNEDNESRFISFSTLESCVNSRLSKNRLNGILRSNVN
jgi:hypothetical protein